MAKRWLGPKHAYKVKKNPLHYSWALESCLRCIRCELVLHKSAFAVGDIYTHVCKECRDALSIKHS